MEFKFILKEKDKSPVKIIEYNIDGNDRIWLLLQNSKERIQFNPKKQVIVLGGKVIEPWLSYAFNKWNVMLPYITYRVDKLKAEEYIKSISLCENYEKEEF